MEHDPVAGTGPSRMEKGPDGWQQDPMSRTVGGLLRAAAVSLIAIAMGPAAYALADPPNVTIESPLNGSVSNDRTPFFSGSTDDPLDEVTLEIYAGTTVKEGAQVQTLGAPLPLTGAWSVGPAEALPDGVYTAQASQTNPTMETGSSQPPVTFTIDTSSPTVTLNRPTSPSNDTTPSFTGFASDTTAVTVQIYAGATASGSVVSTASATHTGGDWTSGQASPSLSSGQYTAVAIQESSLGNPSGTSSPVTFTIDTSPPTVTLSQPESPSNNTTPSFTGTASDTTAVNVKIYAGAASEGPVVSTAAATGTGDAWTSGKASPALASGQYTAIASQESSLGNPAGASAPVTFTVDTSSPVVTLNQPTSPSNDTTPSFTGTASATTAVTVRIYAGAAAEGTVVSTAAATGTGGAWTSSKAGPALASGQYTATATQESALGNPSGVSAPVTFRVETAAPTVTLNSPALRSNNTTPSFTGTASDTNPVTVKIYAGATASGSVVSTATATGTGGAWSSSKASPALASGQYTAVATQASSLGNPTGTSAPVTFVVDTSSPTVTLNQPTSPSNNTTPPFTGAASDITSVTVRIYAGATASGSIVSTATATGTGGAWTSSKASPALASGQYTATATQESSVGNPAGVSAPVTFTVNTSSPTVTLKGPTSPSNNTTPSFTGAASDITSVTVRIYAGATASGSIVSTATATGTGGAWTSSKASPALASGQYTATATQESSLGNPAGVSAPVTFTLDTSSPTVALNQPTSLSNDTTPSFSGTASDSTQVVVHVYSEGSEVSSVAATPHSGSWATSAISPALSSGKHVYTARATQKSSLGNPEGSSNTVSFTVDTTAPSVTLNQQVSRSNDATPSFSGTASDVTPITVEIYAGTTPKGTPLRTVKATGTGADWTSPEVSPALPNGKHTYTAIAVQKSSLPGNPSGTSNPVSFTVDTAAPSVTLNALPPRYNDPTPSFTGTTNESSAVVVHIYDASNSEVSTAAAPATGGSWSTGEAGPALADGDYTAIATQESLFGNHVGETAAIAFTLDTVPPQVTLTYPSGGSSSSGDSQLVTGTAGAVSGDLSPVTVQLFPGSEVVAGQQPVQSIVVNAGAGRWSVTFAGLGTGAYSVRAEQSDAAGNLGVSSPVTFSLTGPSAAPAPTHPTASFSWSPTAPHVGEKVSLLSSSTDAASPIVAFAWDLAGNGAFAPGAPVISTSFATPGRHLVQLRVTDANGVSAVAAETIEVTPPPLPLMQPFPTVRITATHIASGVKLKLLSVRATAGARITVTCTGRGCPIRSRSRVAAAGKAGRAPVEFRSFERSLRAGVVLEIRVSRRGEIGKYTRFAVRRGRLPSRVDACLASTAAKPMACPTS
jgi:hypothetical protein